MRFSRQRIAVDGEHPRRESRVRTQVLNIFLIRFRSARPEPVVNVNRMDGQIHLLRHAAQHVKQAHRIRASRKAQDNVITLLYEIVFANRFADPLLCIHHVSFLTIPLVFKSSCTSRLCRVRPDRR